MSEILQLTHDDYKKVLKYYNYSLPKNYNKTKKIAEKLLNNKLCKCIQKVKRSLRTRNKSIKNSESLRNSVGICKKSVLHKKNIDLYHFKCDKTQKLGNYPNKKFALSKYKNNKTRKNNK